MATLPEARYTLEEYIQLEDTLDYHSEFHDGLILPVESATPTHAQLEVRVGIVLAKALPPPCAVFGSSLNLYIPSVNRIVHPDATVVCDTVSIPKPDCVDNPSVIVEVTSPSTKDYDHGTKREYYFSLPSLQHYLLVSQTERLVSHYERAPGIVVINENFPDAWLYVDHRAGETLRVGAGIPVDSIYKGILLP